MLGTFGMYSQVHPWVDTSFASFSSDVFPMTDKFTDIGFDSQYQYQGDNFWLTLRGSYIREFQRLDSTFANLGSSNPTNLLNTLKLQASVALGGDNRVVLTGQYFDVWGTADATLFGTDPATGLPLTPNSNGFTAEIAYIPFGVSKSPTWPWFNARIGLQYTYYNKLNGTVDELHKLALNLNQGKGSVGKLINDDQLYNRLNGTAGKLENIANQLDSGKGTAGKLLKDETLYNNLNSTLAHANSLLAEADAGRPQLGREL